MMVATSFLRSTLMNEHTVVKFLFNFFFYPKNYRLYILYIGHSVID